MCLYKVHTHAYLPDHLPACLSTYLHTYIHTHMIHLCMSIVCTFLRCPQPEAPRPSLTPRRCQRQHSTFGDRKLYPTPWGSEQDFLLTCGAPILGSLCEGSCDFAPDMLEIITKSHEIRPIYLLQSPKHPGAMGIPQIHMENHRGRHIADSSPIRSPLLLHFHV